MKSLLVIFGVLLASTLAQGAYQTWTNAEGQTAELQLLSVDEKAGEKVGRFRMLNGKVVQLKSSQLSDKDAKLLAAWTPDESISVEGKASVFDEVLKGNLVKLEDSKMVAKKDYGTPKKYLVFYYTASWCPPCRAFTPELVKWYQNNKNDNFELVLITSDRDEQSMEAYAKKNKMPWPQLEMKKVKKFRSAHPHGVRGIPSLVVCDLEGKVLGNYRSNLPGLSKMVGE